jgi:hypothetical protein
VKNCWEFDQARGARNAVQRTGPVQKLFITLASESSRFIVAGTKGITMG